MRSPNLVMAAGEQVAVDIEGRVDFRVAHELLDRFRVRPRVDQQRGEGVAAHVEADRPEQIGLAVLVRGKLSLALVRAPSRRASRGHRPSRRRTPARPCARTPGPPRLRPALPRCASRQSRRIASIGTLRHPARDFGSITPSTWSQPRSMAIRFGVEVDVADPERLQLAAPQTGVESRRPDRAILGRKRGEQSRRFGRGGDSRWPGRAVVRQVDPCRRVVGQLVAVYLPAIEGLNRIEDIADRVHREPGGKQLVGEILNVATAKLAHANTRQPRRIDVNPHGALVGADRVRLVVLPALRTNPSRPPFRRRTTADPRRGCASRARPNPTRRRRSPPPSWLRPASSLPPPLAGTIFVTRLPSRAR